VKRGNDPRILAAQTVSKVLRRGVNLGDALGVNGHQDVLESRDKSFSRHLAYGVLRWFGALDWLASHLLKRPLKARDHDIHVLILIGLFQLWKDESTEYAAVNETAECARRLGKPWAVGLINALLRRFQREKVQWLERLDQQVDRYAHPEWLVNAIQADWPEEWKAILEANNQQAGMWLRINRARAEPETVSNQLRQAGFETRQHQQANDAIEVIPPAPVSRLPGFSEGLWSVQDPAAQLASDWLEAQPGQRILDACAAPGGKTCHILEGTPDTCIVALDRSSARLERLKENAARLGYSESERLKVIAAEAQNVDDWWDQVAFDRILLDAPCTTTGVIRRHPEIKWIRTPEQVEESVKAQAGLLQSLWPLLKPGGILVYATCSVLRVENSEQTSHFIENHPDAEPLPLETGYGRRAGHGCQILPGEFNMDGFYYARFRKS